LPSPNLTEIARQLRLTAANLTNQAKGLNPATAQVLIVEAQRLVSYADQLDPPKAPAVAG